MKAESPPPADDGTVPIFDGELVSRDEGGCVNQVAQAEALPFDLYILFDQSGSMSTPAGSGNRLDAVRAALTDFIRSDDSIGMGAGIGYFGNFPLGEASCQPEDYVTPAVPVGVLPGNASALLGSLNAVVPTGETPTGPAIRGACEYVKGWKTAHPNRELAMLVLTDGIPEAPISRANGCDPTLRDAVQATTECVGNANVHLFVLGVGPNLTNLDDIAQAGGTQSALLVDGGDVTSKVEAALNRIRGTALPCNFELPPPPDGEAFAYDRVNVVVKDTGGTDHALGKVDDQSACGDDGGWYYPPGDSPDRIELCEASCAYAKSQSDGGSVSFALGCKTVTTTR